MPFAPQFPPSSNGAARSYNSFTVHASVRPTVPHRPWPPHLPPPFVPIEHDGHGGSVPGYRSISPPPAYSPTSNDPEDKPLLEHDLEAQPPRLEEVESEVVCEKMSNVVIVILIALNIFVWSAVAWGVICDDEVPKLWAEIQDGDRVVFDV